MTIKDFELVPIVKENEGYVSGKEMLERAKEQGISTGKAEAVWLLEHQTDIPKEWREHYLIFPDYLQDDDGYGYVAYFGWNGKRWELYFFWLDNYFRRYDRFVRRRESLDTRTVGDSKSLDTWPLDTLKINGIFYERRRNTIPCRVFAKNGK